MTNRHVSRNKRGRLKEDRRTSRTRRLLREALSALICEEGYGAVAVQDITERADLNRATFYLHYRDKGDLLLQSSREMLDELTAGMGTLDPQTADLHTPSLPLLTIFQHVASHADFYTALLVKERTAPFIKQMYDAIVRVNAERLGHLRRLHPGAQPLVETPYVANYVAGALIGVITWWLETGLAHSPEYMADRFMWLSMAGLYPMSGLTPPALDEAVP